jgi:hypothetical protein
MRGRSRMVKPEIHSDPDLWDAEQETGLPLFRAFVGVWNFADREGRFEWKPRQLKALILPFWIGDFSGVLEALRSRGYVVRYSVFGAVYGLVRTFHKHQSPNGREAASTIPPPPDELTRASRVEHASSTREARVEHAARTLHDGSVLEGTVLREKLEAPVALPPVPDLLVAAPVNSQADRRRATRERTVDVELGDDVNPIDGQPWADEADQQPRHQPFVASAGADAARLQREIETWDDVCGNGRI